MPRQQKPKKPQKPEQRKAGVPASSDLDEQMAVDSVLSWHVQGMEVREIARRLSRKVDWVEATLKREWEHRAARIEWLAIESRDLELARLDQVAAEMMELVAGGKPGKPGEARPSIVSPDALIQAAAQVLADSKQRAEILGLNAPIKQEISGPNGGAIQFDARTDILSRVAQLAERSRTGGDS